MRLSDYKTTLRPAAGDLLTAILTLAVFKVVGFDCVADAFNEQLFAIRAEGILLSQARQVSNIDIF